MSIGACKCTGGPKFTRMSQALHGLVSQPVFRAGSGAFETVVAVLLLIPKTARLGAGLTVVWMTPVILSHIFVLGYGLFFVDALMVMVLAVIYLSLTRRQSHWSQPESVGTNCPVCRQPMQKKNPTETIPCSCGKYVWKG